MNKVTLSGRLTKDPELRVTQNGTQVLSYTLAVNDSKKNAQTGEWEDVANFFDCKQFGKAAQSLSTRLSKGQKVLIDGKLHYSSWNDTKTGQMRSKVDVNVSNLEFMVAPKNSGAPQPQQGQVATQQAGAVNQQQQFQGAQTQTQQPQQGQLPFANQGQAIQAERSRQAQMANYDIPF